MLAIEYIHGEGYVHGDLKPDNILVDQKFNVKIIDFGEAEKAEDVRYWRGLVDYQPPEAFKSINPDGIAKEKDMWALGLILFEVRFGRHPFSTSDECMAGKLRLPKSLPVWYRRLLTWLLATDPFKRPSASQVCAFLDSVAKSRRKP